MSSNNCNHKDHHHHTNNTMYVKQQTNHKHCKTNNCKNSAVKAFDYCEKCYENYKSQSLLKNRYAPLCQNGCGKNAYFNNNTNSYFDCCGLTCGREYKNKQQTIINAPLCKNGCGKSACLNKKTNKFFDCCGLTCGKEFKNKQHTIVNAPLCQNKCGKNACFNSKTNSYYECLVEKHVLVNLRKNVIII